MQAIDSSMILTNVWFRLLSRLSLNMSTLISIQQSLNINFKWYTLGDALIKLKHLNSSGLQEIYPIDGSDQAKLRLHLYVYQQNGSSKLTVLTAGRSAVVVKATALHSNSLHSTSQFGCWNFEFSAAMHCDVTSQKRWNNWKIAISFNKRELQQESNAFIEIAEIKYALNFTPW
jgi:hypothetical protein